MADERGSNLPKLLFFRRANRKLAPFLAQHLEDQVRILGHSFDVKVVSDDCDYGQVCEQFEPEISVFETGVYSYNQRISNTGAHPDVPKLGFLHSDAYDISRAVFLSNMAEWGVEHFFTTSASMAEYSPEIAGSLFVWPNAVNPEIFRDYGLAKNIPVLLTGSQERHYPWRNAVGRALTERYPTMSMPHFGWGSGTERLVTGANYAKLLNASYFVPACGSMARDVVRKQLEIPAAGACLVTEWSPRLAEFGFVDLVNCVVADQSDVVEKLDVLVRDREQLERITKAGNALVHDRHTEANRNQVREWLELYRQRRPGETIAQETTCSSLSLVPEGTEKRGVVGPGLDRIQLAQGWRLLRANNAEAAEREFLKCLNYYFIPEAITGLVFSSLMKGDSKAALSWVSQALARTLREGGASDPDPVLWACRIRALLCAGETRAAIRSADKYINISHPELDRVRGALRDLLPGSAGTSIPYTGTEPIRRPSIASVPETDLAEWTQEFAEMLFRCGPQRTEAPQNGAFFAGHQPPAATHRPQWQQVLAVARRAVDSRLTSGPVVRLRMALSPLKQRFVSTDWSRSIKETVRREHLTRALLIGKANPKDCRALQSGLALNPGLPPLQFSDSIDDAASRNLLPRTAGERVLVLLEFLKDDIGHHDPAHLRSLSACELVMIRGTTTSSGFHLFAALVESGSFAVVAHNGPQGTVVLRRPPKPFHGLASAPSES